MHGLYANDASMLDSIGRLMIVALFLIIGIRNLQKFHIDDHIARLTKFKAFAVYLLDPSGEELKVAYSVGYPEEIATTLRVKLGLSLIHI